MRRLIVLQSVPVEALPVNYPARLYLLYHAYVDATPTVLQILSGALVVFPMSLGSPTGSIVSIS